MTYIVALHFTEVGRTKLCVVLGALNWLCFFASLSLIASGTYIKLSLEEFTNLVLDYNDKILPYSLLGLGLISVVFCFFGGLLYFFNHDPNYRKLLVPMFYVFILLDGLLSFCILGMGIFCYVHIRHLEEAFHGGLKNAMEAYKTDLVIKVDLDLLQIEYKCCGSLNYSDWFRTDWILEEYRDKYTYGVQKQTSHNNKTSFLHDNTPFSCCDPQVMRPCINVDILGNKNYTDYNPKNATIFMDGCLDSLMDFFGDTVLVTVGTTVFFVFALKELILVLTRILQTSILTAVSQDEPLGPSIGYLFKCGSEQDKEVPDNEERTQVANVNITRGIHPVGSEEFHAEAAYVNTKDLTSTYQKTPGDIPIYQNDQSSDHMYLNDNLQGEGEA